MNSLLRKVRAKLTGTELSPMAQTLREDRLTYLTPERLRRLERGLQAAARATRQGDFLEFGVALGGSTVLIASHAKKAKRRFAGFDVFATIPPPTSEKDDDKSRDRYKVIAEGQSRGLGGDEYYGYMPDLYDRVAAAMARYGYPVDGENVQLVKGLFEETWPTFNAGPIAFAHVDCDWYDPVKYCLEAIDPHMQPGGVVLIDDYNDYGGAKTATDEFLAGNSRYRMEQGANVMLHRIA